jgi:glyoxylase-like metal-dependent hydrolase (beta-lactamase superfamily II)
MNPHAHVVASEATRKLLSENGAQRLKQSLEQMRARLNECDQQRARSKDQGEVRRLTEEAAGIRNYIAEMKSYTPELPDLTFDRELVLHDKAHDLHLAFRGRAHTEGDVVVFCPQKKVVATGDMIHSLLPYIADGFPHEWPKTMQSVAELSFDHVIGGHGPVQNGKAHLHGMAAYIEEITSAVAREKDKSLTQLQSSITPSTLRSLTGDYGKFVLQNLGASGSAANAPNALAAGVRGNVAQVYERLSAG